jgi:DNA mismatch endonuclease (patch repair protein)
LPKFRTAVFVHGCFWHRHPHCRFAYNPKSRVQFWLDKFATNVRRDRAVSRQLRQRGWKVVIVWECELRKPDAVVRRLDRILTARKELSA